MKSRGIRVKSDFGIDHHRSICVIISRVATKIILTPHSSSSSVCPIAAVRDRRIGVDQRPRIAVLSPTSLTSTIAQVRPR